MLIAGHSSIRLRIRLLGVKSPEWSKLRKTRCGRQRGMLQLVSPYHCRKSVDQVANRRQPFLDTSNTKSPRNPFWKGNIRSRVLPAALTLLLGSGVTRPQALYQAPGPSTTFPVGNQPGGVAVADFARTGYPGLVVANSASNNMTVYLGSATGTFGTPATVPTCSGPGQAIAADFNNDDYPDIAVVCPSAGDVEVFLNDRAGGFGTGTAIAVAQNSVALVAGDFNGDGYADIVAASCSGSLTVLLTSHASITSSETSNTYSGPSSLVSLTAGYFDNSGHLDLAVADAADAIIGILIGWHARSFVPVSLLV